MAIHGVSRWLCALGAASTLVLGAGLAGCGSDGDEGSLPATTTSVGATGDARDPLAGPVVDACGNDLSALTSTVWGVDPATGTERWSTTVPLAESFLLRDESGDPRLSLVLRPVEVVVDATAGGVAGYPDAGVHEVLVDPTSAAETGSAGLLVDGEPQPATIDVGNLRITTAAGTTGQTTIGLTATDAATAAPAWRFDLGAADAVAALSSPVMFGDTVVVVTSSPRPSCDPG